MMKADLTAKFSGRRYTTVPVGDETLRIRSLTSAERNAWDASKLDDKGEFNTEKAELGPQRLIAMCVVDDDGKLLFGEPNDIAFICTWDDAITRQVYEACVAHMTKRPESIAKNS